LTDFYYTIKLDSPSEANALCLHVGTLLDYHCILNILTCS